MFLNLNSLALNDGHLKVTVIWPMKINQWVKIAKKTHSRTGVSLGNRLREYRYRYLDVQY